MKMNTLQQAAAANKVLKKVQEYDANRAKIAQLEVENIRLRDAIINGMLESGVDPMKSTVMGDFSLGVVQTNRTTLDKKKLLAQGVSMEQIEAATVTSASTPYLRITRRAPSNFIPGCEG